MIVQFNSQGLSNIKKNWKLLMGGDVIVIQETFIKHKAVEKTMATLDRGYWWRRKTAFLTSPV